MYMFTVHWALGCSNPFGITHMKKELNWKKKTPKQLKICKIRPLKEG